MGKPKLLLVVNSTTNFVSKRQELATAAVNQGFEVHIATPSSKSISSNTDVCVHQISLKRRSTHPIKELRTLLSFIRVYRSIQPDLVHHFTIKPIVYGSLTARLLRTPIIINNFTGLGAVFQDGELKSSPLQRTIIKLLKFGTNRPNVRFIFQNPDDEAFMLERGVTAPEKTTVIRGSGVRIDQYQPTQDKTEPPLVVLPGRMLWTKGINEFVHAATVLEQSGIDARFALVGDSDPGNPDTIHREQLESWDTNSSVEWWGWQDDMNQVYSKANIVCLPSYREGVPQVILEAAASQLPVVTTDVPGCREAVIDRETGFLVQKKDSEGLAKALKTLIDNKDLRIEYGRSGRNLVKKEFSRKYVVEQTIDVYQELLDGARQGS